MAHRKTAIAGRTIPKFSGFGRRKPQILLVSRLTGFTIFPIKHNPI
jgi:hypothetical protein